MKLSARNQVAGVIRNLKAGSVMAELVVEVAGGLELVSVITMTSVESLGLTVGKEVIVVIKSTEVMLAVEE